jgi:hypothetical protein
VPVAARRTRLGHRKPSWVLNRSAVYHIIMVSSTERPRSREIRAHYPGGHSGSAAIQSFTGTTPST